LSPRDHPGNGDYGCTVPLLVAKAEAAWFALEHWRAAATDQPQDPVRALTGAAERVGWHLAAHPHAPDDAQAVVVETLTRVASGLVPLGGSELAQVIAEGLEGGAANYRELTNGH
jgi:hypothetical protein